MLECVELPHTAVAPSPIVPTCRGNSSLSKRKRLSMSAVQTMPVVAGNNARAAGGTGKAARDDNLAELARFFQMTGPGPTPPGSNTPSNIPSNTPDTPDPVPQSTAARDFFKASQRRLRQLAPRQKRDSFSKASKSDESYRHLLALQRDGFLPVSKPPKSSASKSSRASTIRDSQSLDSLVTDPKRDVENIGQPWLEDKGEGKESQDDKANRLGSLDLSEFGQLVKLAVASPDGELSPTYQTSFSSERSNDNRLSMEPHAQTSYESKDSQSIDQAAPANVRPASGQSNHVGRTTPVSDHRAGQIAGQEHSSTTPAAGIESTSNDFDGIPSMTGAIKSVKSAQREATNIPASHAANSQPAIFDAKQHVQHLPTQPLKLFPDVTPPRTSSKPGMRKADGRQQPVVSLSTVPESRPGSTCVVPDNSNGGSASGSKAQDKPDPYLRLQSAARTSSSHSTSTEPGSAGNGSDETANSDRKSKGRPMSLPMAAAINAFPLPAPTRPLPALPPPESTNDARQGRNETSNSRMARASATPRDLRQLSHLSSRNRSVTPTAHRTAPNPKPVAGVSEANAPKEEEEEGPAQKFQFVTSQTTPALLAKTRQNRAERVRALRLRDISHRRFYPNAERTDVDLPQRVASPMLLQTAPHQRKHGIAATQKRAADGGVERDEGAQVAGLPDFPSPPPLQSPAANLPARPSTADPIGRRSSYSPTSIKAVPLSRHGSISSPDPYRSSTRCRSSSTRTASICREMTYGEERTYDSDSPLPSSADEALGMASTSLVHDVSCKTRGMKKRKPSKRNVRQNTSEDHIPSQSHRHHCQAPGKPPHHSPRSHRTHRSQDGQAAPSKQSTSARDSLEGRVAQLEQQNKMLQAALMGVLNAGGNASTDGLLSGLASSLSTSKSSPAMRRRVSSTASNYSSMEEPILPSRPRRSHPRRPAYRKGHKRPGQNSSFSSYGSSVRRGRELEDMMEDIEYGWSSDRSSLAGERLVQ